ncbi:MAG: ADP-ribosylglycohydrolase family protein [Desulfovibrionaceae bacterium]
MNDARKALIIASLAGDSLALGAHWEYDPARIAATHGRVETLLAPAPGSYHAGKGAGDFTHYGDQTMVLLESVAARGSFDLDDFFDRWKTLFDAYAGYRDMASKKTLSRIEFGEGPLTSGSPSNDLAGASRIAPILALPETGDALVAAAMAQTRMTHNNPQVVEAAAFFARATRFALAGASVTAALEQAAAAADPALPIAGWAAAGLALRGMPSVEALGTLGRTCHIDQAFPGTVQLLARHGDDLKTCLVENVMAGGDSAARGLLAGMVLGAAHGLGAVPGAWTDGLRRKDEILTLLNALP